GGSFDFEKVIDKYGKAEMVKEVPKEVEKPTETQREATTLDYETLDATGKEIYRQAALSNSQGDFLKRIQEGVGLKQAEDVVGKLGAFREQVQKQELAEAHKKTEMSRKIAEEEKAGKRIVTVDDDGLLHVHAGINLVESAKALRDVSLKIIEPMKLVQMKHGKDLAAELIDSYFKADYETEKIMDMKHGEQTYEEMKNEFAHLPKKDLKNFSNAYLGGNPDSDDGKKIRQRALSELPDFLKDPRLVKAQKELAKINDFYRKSIFGDDIPSIEDYFYGKFKITDKEKFDKFIHSHKGVVDSYNKKKGILSVADASAYGYELIHKNPFENLEQEARDMGFYAGHKSLSKIILGDTRYSKKTLPTSLVSVLRGTKMSNDNEFIQSARRQMGKTDKGTDKFRSALNRWYKKSGFYKKGTSFSDKVALLRKHYFELKDLEDKGWKPIRIGGFYEGYIVEKTIADVIGSLSSTNKISRNKLLNAVRIFNRNAQSILFLGSGFHLINVSVQSVVDTRLRDVIKGYGFREIIKSFGGIKKKDKELPYYKTFRLSGGAGEQSLQAEAERTISKTLRKFDSIRYEIDKKEHKRFRAMTERILGKTVLLPPKFVKFLFGKYIPALKFYKSKYEHDVKRMQLGRELTKAENQDIIKETQNFYGMMNEALFGRSGTMTTAMRLFFLAPGFAEGNLRTIYLSYSNLAKVGKKLTKLDFKGSYEELKYGYGSRSTRNVVQMQMAMIMAATVGSLIMTGKPPKVEKWEDIQDLFKIQTNFLDKHGNPVPINLCPVGIDYNNFTFYPIAKAIGAKNPYKYFETMTEKLGSRLIGMQAGAVGVVRDMLTLATGRSVVDWDNNEIVKVDDTNPFIHIMAYEVQRFTPFAVQSWNRGKRRGIDWRVNLASALSGFRPSRNNPDSEGLKLYWKIKEYKDRQEDIYSELYKDYKNPMKIIDKYNKGVDEFVNSEDVKRHFSRQNPIMTKEEFDKRVDRLKIHPDKYLQEKVYSLTHKNQENREGIIKLLKSFDVDSYDKAYKLLIDCSKRRGLGRETSRQRANILSKIYKNEK
ncbi:MAG: hypothetical protein H8D45_24250, partial [Bacteroidetes bacterium]|nr:hypothetical protein [Bacteroidota bacterium]